MVTFAYFNEWLTNDLEKFVNDVLNAYKKRGFSRYIRASFFSQFYEMELR